MEESFAFIIVNWQKYYGYSVKQQSINQSVVSLSDLSSRFALSAVSPAVVVPSLLTLSDAGYGLDKGIPTLVIAAATIDDVFNITGFGVLLGMVFSQGKRRVLPYLYS